MASDDIRIACTDRRWRFRRPGLCAKTGKSGRIPHDLIDKKTSPSSSHCCIRSQPRRCHQRMLPSGYASYSEEQALA